MAQGVALRMLVEAPTPDHERLRFGFRACLSREPTAEELVALSEYLASQRKRFSESDTSERIYCSRSCIIPSYSIVR